MNCSFTFSLLMLHCYNATLRRLYVFTFSATLLLTLRFFQCCTSFTIRLLALKWPNSLIWLKWLNWPNSLIWPNWLKWPNNLIWLLFGQTGRDDPTVSFGLIERLDKYDLTVLWPNWLRWPNCLIWPTNLNDPTVSFGPTSSNGQLSYVANLL